MDVAVGHQAALPPPIAHSAGPLPLRGTNGYEYFTRAELRAPYTAPSDAAGRPPLRRPRRGVTRRCRPPGVRR
ncbi:hypothetical protein PAHAL_2G133800 [Panicum hallii]|uniref:Uncharacterized protein n=1 Tax=Panicum hallii TaxID=206008 RepID=A0A2T8KP06_9POAL|nr:hypothetical protein PAHAL_2G133800 [Panicum hallii]